MSLSAELIAVGTELLLGSIANTDAQYLSQELSQLGINVYYHSVVGDNPQRVKEAVDRARRRADIILTTGGLGPTCDDLTKNVVAAAFGRELVFHAPSAERIRERFARMGRPMTDNNLQQAMLPEGCLVLDNDWGTAPGCIIEEADCRAILLPGPPRECKALFEHRVAPYLAQLSDGVIASRTLRIYGMGEAAVESLLREKMEQLENPTLAPYAKEGEMELRITARGRTAQEARERIAPVEAQVREILGDKIYGADVASLEALCFSLLKEAGLTLALAESCTGGLMAKRLTDLPGSSQVFLGGVVSYSDSAKARFLQVPEELLCARGAVSPEVARAMAEGVRRQLNADVALSVTGLAGPEGDSWGNPVGRVYLGLAASAGCVVKKLEAGQISRERVRTMAAHAGFNLLRRYLLGTLTLE